MERGVQVRGGLVGRPRLNARARERRDLLPLLLRCVQSTGKRATKQGTRIAHPLPTRRAYATAKMRATDGGTPRQDLTTCGLGEADARSIRHATDGPCLADRIGITVDATPLPADEHLGPYLELPPSQGANARPCLWITPASFRRPHNGCRSARTTRPTSFESDSKSCPSRTRTHLFMQLERDGSHLGLRLSGTSITSSTHTHRQYTCAHPRTFSCTCS